MRKIINWYKNLRLKTRVVLSINLTIIVCISMISVFASINRQRIQKADAEKTIHNEINHLITVLNFSKDRQIEDFRELFTSKVFYNTGYASLISSKGQVLISKHLEGQNISSTERFLQLHNKQRGHAIYSDPLTQKIHYQYFAFYQPLDSYIVATVEKKEFIDKAVWNTLRILLIAMIFTLGVFTLVNHLIMRTITRPLNGLISLIRQLGKGDLAEKFEYVSQDEIGEMTSSVNALVEGLKNTALFANEIGKNNFDHPFSPLSDKDLLGNALIEMKQSLKHASDEEKIRKVEDEKRNWTTQGLARFADILRQNNDNIHELSYDIVSNLTEYLNINQGGVFIFNDEEKEDKHLELTACYAFDRRKFIQKRIELGEGLVGTCFIEKETIYLTQVPQDYIRITSGLGDENPSALLIVPLKLNNETYGVIELASFRPFEQYQIEFVQKIGESIASTISSVKINSQTARLLQKSQQQAEEMRAQEEEMRQNMEELTATQEAMAEKDRDNQLRIAQLNQENETKLLQISQKEQEHMDILENCPESVVKSDISGKILFFNKAAEKLWGYKRQEILGRNVKVLMPETYAMHHDQYMGNYLQSGHKKIIGIGRQIEVKHQSGEEIPAFLTIIETKTNENQYFTGFFKDLRAFGQAIEKPLKGQKHPSGHPAPAPPPAPTPAKSQSEPADETPISELHQGETDTQKAWSEHLDQTGTKFKKGKKK